jgi:hypothetical protein
MRAKCATAKLVPDPLEALVATCASAQAQQRGSGSAAQIMSSIPANSKTITHWYKQSVYDPQDNKIGEIMDVLVDRDGKVTALIIGVGGFLGLGEKDVAVPFNPGCPQECQGLQVRPQRDEVGTGGKLRHHRKSFSETGE